MNFVVSLCRCSTTDGYDSEAGAPDDTDHPEDDAEELEMWRVSLVSYCIPHVFRSSWTWGCLYIIQLWQHREIARIKRDEEERIRLQKEKEETERRRSMTDEERKREDE